MRFRIHPLLFSLLCSCSISVYAEDELCVEETPCAVEMSLEDEEDIDLRMDYTFNKLPAPDQDTPTFIEADTIVGQKNNQIEATGNAILRKMSQSISADRLSYAAPNLDAQGNVVLIQNGNTMTGPRLTLNMDTNVGQVDQPKFYLAENEGRGSGSVMHIQDKSHYTLDDATYTTCPPNDDAWQLKMSKLELNRETQIGVAHNSRVEFMNVPVLYFPWMDFSLSSQRKSGFLAPRYTRTNKGGMELSVPYYWNIAPNYDATITPRIMAKRGVMINNEIRYLQTGFNGEMNIDMLPQDNLLERGRGRFTLKHNQTLPLGARGYINFTRVSDDDYFRDFADSVNATSQTHLPQEFGMNYGGNWWNTALRIQQYQTLQDRTSPYYTEKPYSRLPQVTLNAQQNIGKASINLSSEYVDFSHPRLVNGSRLVINPSMSYSLVNNSAMYITPKFGLHSTRYTLDPLKNNGYDDASRTVPIFSIDSSLALERNIKLFNKDHIHTLEPRVFYVYIPYREQSQLPNFDSAQADFSLVQMFTENRFFGQDRIGDANHITLSVASQFLDKNTGTSRLRLTMSERFSFAAPRVYLVTPNANNNRSDILMSVEGLLTNAWSLESGLQFAPNTGETQRYNLATHYHPEPGKIFNLSYRFQRENRSIRNIDLSTQWPLSDKWHLVGRWNYSLLDKSLTEAIAGLEYNRDCWTLRMVGQRWSTATQEMNNSIFLQLELNGLVKLGSDPLAVLKRSVYGYTKINDKNFGK